MSEIHPVNSVIETASGRFFDFDAPEFDIEDIATHLSNLNRYTGAVGQYSIAEHCVMVSHLTTGDPLEGLMHDAPEAYINDLSSPVKRREGLTGYRDLEDSIWKPMAKHFGLDEMISDETHAADNAAAYIEAAVLLPSGGKHWPQYAEHQHLIGIFPVHRWSPDQARLAFMNRFEGLMRNRRNQESLQVVFNG